MHQVFWDGKEDGDYSRWTHEMCKMWYRFSHVLNLWAEIKIKYSLCTDYSNVGLTLALYEISEK